MIIHEPVIDATEFENMKVVNNFEALKLMADVIVANCLDDDLKPVREKVYTRDIFSRD